MTTDSGRIAPPPAVRCACPVHLDAAQCISLRTRSLLEDEEDDGHGEREECECSCHDEWREWAEGEDE